jgi:glycyl-tRNA synthetase beta subunit
VSEQALRDLVSGINTAIDAQVALTRIAAEVLDAAVPVQARWGDYHSAHEAYGVMMEEVEEFWEIVKVRQENRDLAKMRAELVDIAVCAMRTILSLDRRFGRV